MLFNFKRNKQPRDFNVFKNEYAKKYQNSVSCVSSGSEKKQLSNETDRRHTDVQLRHSLTTAEVIATLIFL